MRWIVAVTAIKLALAAAWGHTADIPQTELQARAWLAGANVLDPAATGSNPSFFPLGHYALAAACLKISEAFRLPFAWVVKAPAILADGAIAWLLGFTPGGAQARRWYLWNPVAWLLSVYHGQFHTVATALALAGVWLTQRSRWWAAGALLGLAAGVRQHFAVLAAPWIWWQHGRPRLALIAGCAATALALTIPLMAGEHGGRLLAPTWTFGSWGFTLMMAQGPRLLELAGWQVPEAWHAASRGLAASGSWWYLAWAVVFAWWSARAPHRDPWRAALLFLLGLYAISPGFGVQWLIWAVPFWLVVDLTGATRYTLLAGSFLAGCYWQAGLNARYGVESITGNLTRLRPIDLSGVVLVGALGVVTWAYCVRQAWRLR